MKTTTMTTTTTPTAAEAQQTLRKASLVLKRLMAILDDAKYIEHRAAAHLNAVQAIHGPSATASQPQRDKIARAGDQLDQASTATAAAQTQVDEAESSIKALKY